jgi:hypothetical protein
MQLSQLLNGGAVKEYEIALQKRSIPTPRERVDASWLYQRPRLWTEPTPKKKKKKK